jgi:uncharacterized RDD family membrane protein YckC
MPCPLCGDICRCGSEEGSSATPRWLPEVDLRPDPARASQEVEETDESTATLPPEIPLLGDGSEAMLEDFAVWRQEVAARLNRYQSRRKPRPPRYPSLRLRFEAEDLIFDPTSMTEASVSQIMPVVSNQALAFDRFTEDSQAMPEPLPAGFEATRRAAEMPPEIAPVPAAVTAKIIEFPRSWTPPPAPLDELAEPVITRPRILEAPEVVPPPPALGGITIEPARQPEMEKRPGIDIPLQGAPVARRVLSALIDGVIVAVACALFGFIFWKLTAIRPPRLQIISVFAALGVVFWAAYQYLLMVYAGATPGLRLARLELARFDGSPAGRGLRRWRVLASYLSAASLGMGYGWIFLDEDSLCWHDRITHTYLALKMHEPTAAKVSTKNQ